MDSTRSRIAGGEDHILSLGTSVGWVESRLRDLEAKIEEQKIQIATLERQVAEREEEEEKEVALSLSDSDEGGEGE
jgi:predicted RNase H-like nuclease (RuvC/YqgF family)